MEWDPLVAKAEVLISDRKRVQETQGLSPDAKSTRMLQVFLWLWPSVQYVYALFACTYAVHDAFYTTTGSLIALFALNLFLSFLVARPWAFQLGMLGAAGVSVGSLLGCLLYSFFMIFFFGYRDLRTFTNVVASQSPEQFADAGMLGFARSSGVDDSRAVGFKSFAEGGTMYCLAPIIDESMALTSTVSFWAVGENCCGSRSKFQCGDAHVPGANVGVVVLKPEMFVPPGAMWMMQKHRRLLDNYRRAVRLAENVFDIHVPAENTTNVFVQWSRRPYSHQDTYKFKADAYASSAAMLGVLIFGVQAMRKKAGKAQVQEGSQILV